MKIAILEDDESQAKVISIFLESAHHTFKIFSLGTTFQESLGKEHFDLYIFDWELPDTSGIEVLKWTRDQHGWDTPVLFLTARNSKEDIVMALESGADDYMVKPVDYQEFLARVNTLGRRRGHIEKKLDKVNYGDFTVYTHERRISLSGNDLSLTPKEYELSALLFESAGRLLPRNEILKSVWGIEAEINTRTVDTHISRIRKKLELEPKNGWLLSSIYHHGYRLERVST